MIYEWGGGGRRRNFNSLFDGISLCLGKIVNLDLMQLGNEMYWVLLISKRQDGVCLFVRFVIFIFFTLTVPADTYYFCYSLPYLVPKSL